MSAVMEQRREQAVKRYRFSADDYERMIEVGIFAEDDRLELLEGEVVLMAPIGRRHMACVKRLNRILSRRLGDDLILSVQDPVRMTDLTEPQPDLALLRFRDDFYEGSIPAAADVLLIIEVADTSITYDRQEKAPLYARAGIPEFWLVDLNTDTITVFAQPAEGEYRTVKSHSRGETVSSATFPDLSLPAEEILGASA